MTNSSTIERWSLQDILDPGLRARLIQDPDAVRGLVDMEFTDGVIRCSKRVGLLNLFFLTIPAAFNIPLRKDHFIKRIPFNRSNLTAAWEKYYDEIMALGNENAKPLKQAIWKVWQDLYEFCSIELLPWVGTLDIMDLAEIMTDPVMKPIIETKEKISPEMGTNVIEAYIDAHNKQIMKLLGTKGALQCEALYPYQHIGQLNKFQVPQTMYAFGVRTDVSDNIVGYPVIGSAISGLRNIQEFAVESLSAKKSAFYSKSSISESQYFGRTVELALSILQHAYARDCGSTHLVQFKVTEQNWMNVMGKLIVVDGKPLYLNVHNIEQFIGHDVYMRSPMTCKFRKGVCVICGGKVYDNINHKVGVGILSGMRVIEPTTQKILSAKHLIKTSSIIYQIPGEAAKLLYIGPNNSIAWKPEIYGKVKHLLLGVPLRDINNIHDITVIRADKPVKEERFSSISEFHLKDSKGNINHYVLQSQDKQLPFFSTEMLMYIRDHFDKIQIDDEMMWIPLMNTDKFPLFKTIVINDNMRLYVDRVEKFLSKQVIEYTTCADALAAFSEVVHSKVQANIVHLETILKAYMITSNGDYRIPRVEDPNNVIFASTNAILSNRCVGSKLAYQGLGRYVCQPSTYLVQHQSSPFDPLSIGL